MVGGCDRLDELVSELEAAGGRQILHHDRRIAWQVAAEPLNFETHVRPILKAQCWQCHGEEEELKGALDAAVAV